MRMECDKTTAIAIPDNISSVSITGYADKLLHLVQDTFSSHISLKENTILIKGGTNEDHELAVTFYDNFLRFLAQGDTPTDKDIQNMLSALKHENVSPKELRDDVILSFRGRTIRPKTSGQKNYVDAIRNHTITFGVGPAGTGKTYLAMAMALAALDQKYVSRIILSRPIVEAGENLGFLPGTLTEKVDPYIRPLYDSLFDMMDAERAASLLDRGVIEIAPLAFMRGRTLNNSFVILDEAQNATREQMKMFLTRLGENSRMVITGDMSQSDLSAGAKGLQEATAVLEGIEDIACVRLKGKDVVRHSLVSQIIKAYEKHAPTEVK